MVIELKLLKFAKETASGFPLVIKFSHKTKRKQKIIGYSKIEHFIDDHKMISAKHPDFAILFPIISEYKYIANKIILEGVTDVDKAYRLLFENNFKEPPFLEFCENLFSELENEITVFDKKNNIVSRNKASGNLKVYKNVVNQFESFVMDLPASEFTYDLLNSFRNELLLRENAKSTIHQYLRTLRALYNKAALKYGFENTKPFNGVFTGLKTKSFHTKKKYILKEDIQKLEQWSGPAMKTQAVDLFLLQFYFGGADLIDIYYLENKQIANNRLYFERGKTNTGKLIDLAIHEKAAAILKKYKTDAIYIFPFRKDVKGYETFRSRYARSLKAVQQDLEIFVNPTGGNISVKVARHTFANIGKNLMIEPDILRELMGHERDEVDNYYKDSYPKEVRDKALFEIIG